MGGRRNMPINLLPCLFTLFFIIVFLSRCAAIDTITPNQYISDSSQTLVSLPDEIFKLGFFKLGNCTNRYVGIWYNNIPGPTIVWVANRDKPLNDSSGVVRIAKDGNLVVLDGRGNLLWTTNVSNIASTNLIAELLDSGNLVLREKNGNTKGRTLWQSFDHPSDTLLPMMEFGVNLRTGEKQVLTSWRDTNSDPSRGSFTLELDPFGDSRIFIKNDSDYLHWRSGPLSNKDCFKIYDAPHSFLLLRDNTKGTVYLILNYETNSVLSRIVLDSDGKLVERKWDEEKKNWYEDWFSPRSECDIYGKCGPFGSCDMLDSPICSCLRGFEPKFKDEWRNGNWSGGCVRRTELQCERNNQTYNNVGGGKEADRFLMLKNIKLPDNVNWMENDNVNWRDSDRVCEEKCLEDCSCRAYSSSNWKCKWWTGDMIKIQKLPMDGGEYIHIRVAYSEIGNNAKLSIIIIVLIGIIPISIGIYFCWRWVAKQRHFWRWMAKQKGSIHDYYIYLMAVIGRMKRGMRKSVQREKRRRERKKMKKDMRVPLFDMDDGYGEPSDSGMLIRDNPELKIFTFENLATATNNFSEANKLGHGGFGSVYKGKLLNGQEIAVKRLSKNSGQGLQEFKNEVLVISRLQHRNLVRLLGCSIQEDEKILIYEFMPNKSLDAFLFDTTKRAILDWRKRFLIIEGISRGVLYLHRDSRLRVIHRDLKASNILLDENLNPKISDFGMAKIFGGDELQANTRRVAGTFGYMPPEYFIEGRFSEKSDVFSFGVLLLEIVSGKKSTSLYHEELSLRLLGYAWKLWNENKVGLLIDPILLSDPSFEQEIMRCIHVGLLCVQEFAEDRPTMSTTLSMLTSQIASLPNPKHPAFTEKRVSSKASSSQNKRINSINNVTITSIGGR